MSYSVAKSVTKNTALMMGAQAVTWVSGLVLLIFLPRTLGSEDFGRLYLAMSVQIIFQYLISFGGQYQITKEISRNPDKASEVMSDSTIVRIGLWVASIAVTALLCYIARYSYTTVLMIFILGLSNLWVGVTTLIRFFFQGIESMKYPSISAVVERTFLLITVVPALLLGAKEIVVVALMAVSTLLSFIISVKFADRLFKFNFSVNVGRIRALVADGLPYFLWSLFGIIYYRIDAVLLSVMVPVAVVGWYGAAYRLFDIIMFLPSIFTQALYPILSRFSKSEFDSMKKTSGKSLELLMLAAIPIAVGLIMFAKPLVHLLFGLKEYGPTVGVIQLFSAGMIFVYADFVLAGTVFALDKQKQWAMVAFAGVFVNVGLNTLLIRHFQVYYQNGGLGAAIATDLTEFFVMCWAIVLLPKEIFTRRLFAVIAKGVVSGVVMWGAIAATGTLDIPWVVRGVIGVLFYGASLLLLSTFEPSELAVFRTAVSPRNLRQFLSARKGIDA